MQLLLELYSINGASDKGPFSGHVQEPQSRYKNGHWVGPGLQVNRSIRGRWLKRTANLENGQQVLIADNYIGSCPVASCGWTVSPLEEEGNGQPEARLPRDSESEAVVDEYTECSQEKDPWSRGTRVNRLQTYEYSEELPCLVFL